MADHTPDKLMLSVVTREQRVLERGVDEVVLKGAKGYMGVLPGHTPMLAMLEVGQLMYREGSDVQRMVLGAGFAEVLPDRVIVLADAAKRPEDIDRATAEADLRQAHQTIASLAEHDEAWPEAKRQVDDATARLDLLGRAGV